MNVAATLTELDYLKQGLDLSVELIYCYRIFLSLVLGALIGISHSSEKINLGMKTYAALSMGSCIFSSIGLHIVLAYNNQYGIGVTAGVVTGVGFLGAGVLFQEGSIVRGLSSSATLWATAAVGLSAAMGAYVIAIGGAGFIILFHLLSRSKYIKSSE